MAQATPCLPIQEVRGKASCSRWACDAASCTDYAWTTTLHQGALPRQGGFYGESRESGPNPQGCQENQEEVAIHVTKIHHGLSLKVVSHSSLMAENVYN